MSHMLITSHMSLVKERFNYTVWRRALISAMLDAPNYSSCVHAMSKAIQDEDVKNHVAQSLNQAVGSIGPGKRIGDNTPLIESDGTGADLDEL